MGYVYSPRQVKAGEFPSSNDVKTAFDMAKDELWVLHRSGYLLGAKMHGGSFNNSGECLVGGDIDVIAVTSSIEANSHLANIYRMIKKKKKVPLEIVPYPKENAERGLHYIDPFFFDHLQNSKGHVIGDDPLNFIKLDTSVSLAVTLKERVESHIRRLGVWSSQINERYDEDHCKLLECIIRWPIYDALDVIRVKLGFTPKNENGNIIGKAEICERYREEFPTVDTKGLFSILGLRKRYRELINNPPVNMKDYIKSLGDMDSSLGDAYSFITENDALLSEYIIRVYRKG